MSLFQILGKKEEKKISILDLTDEQRAEIEDQTAQGIKAVDCAKSLNIPVEVIYAYRKMLSKAGSNQNDLQQVIGAKLKEKELLKIDWEIEKSKQELELSRLKFQQDMKKWKAELLEGSEQEEVEEDNSGEWLEVIKQALPHVFKQNSTPTANNTVNPPTQTETQNPPRIEENSGVDLTDEQIRDIIQDLPKEYLKIGKKLPDALLFAEIKKRFPKFTDDTINRAIQIVKE